MKVAVIAPAALAMPPVTDIELAKDALSACAQRLSLRP